MSLIIWLFIIGGVCVIASIILVLKLDWDECELWPFWTIGAICFLIALCLWGHWTVRSHKLEVFNNFMGTEFTKTQYFWAGEEIYDLYTDYELGAIERKDIVVEGIDLLD